MTLPVGTMSLFRKRTFILGSLAGMAVALVLAGTVIVKVQASGRMRRDAPLAEEGHRAAERFMKTHADEVLRSLGTTSDLGGFLRMEGAGFGHPVWNIQGHDFLNLV